METDINIINARAFLYDLLSIGFAYPTEELHQSIANGQFAKEARERLALLPEANSCQAELDKLAKFGQSLATNFGHWQTEYIALFEHSQGSKTLHLNAHLYTDDKAQPIPAYRRLQQFYHDFNIELSSNDGHEQPDHLSIQLEFFAYLHRLLALALDGHPEQPIEKVKSGISRFCTELIWTKNFTKQFARQSNHGFYVPLAHLMLILLDQARANGT